MSLRKSGSFACTILVLAAVSVSALQLGCNSAGSETPTNPVPRISSISPSFALIGSKDATITVTGTGFIPASSVLLNGAALRATFVSSTQLTAVVPAADETAVGKSFISVINPPPGGGNSGNVEFDVVAAALTVNIIDLPIGTGANVTVTEPGGATIPLTSSQTITGTEGTYTVAAAKVVVGSDTYRATVPTQSLGLATGQLGTLTVDYYDIIPDTTKVLDSAGVQTMTISSDGSTLTISDTSFVAQSLQSGDVLVSTPAPAAPHGLLRRVSAVSQSGSNIVVTTTPATLADEVKRARVNLTMALTPPPMPSSAQDARNIRLRSTSQQRTAAPSSLPDPCAGSADSFTIPLNVSLPPDSSGNTINASGNLEFCSVNIGFDLDTTALSAGLKVGLQEHSRVVVQGRYSTSFDQTIPLKPSDLADFVVCLGNDTCTAILGLPDAVGDALIVLTPVITPFAHVSGNAAVGFYTAGTEEGQLQAGLSIQNGQLTPVSSSSLQPTSDPSSLDGSLSVKGALGVEFGLELFGSVTGHVDPDGFLQLNADTGKNPWWTLNGGAEADAGLTLSLLGFFSHDFDTSEFQIFSVPIDHASGAFSAQPVVNMVAPNSAMVGSSALLLSLSGSDFVPGAYVSFNGNKLQTTFIDATDLTAILPAGDLTVDGTFPVTVTNPDATGAISAPVNFSVSGILISVSPTSADVRLGGNQQVTASVLGPSNTGVTWSVDGITSGNSTVGTIDASGLYTAPAALPNPNQVTVTATSVAVPSQSASATLALLNPVPLVNLVSPSAIPVGKFTLTVSGSKFAPGATVSFGGTALTTTFVSSTQLTATGTATVAQVGNVPVTVTNPDPGSATSAAFNVTVTNVTGGGSGSTAILGNKAYVPLTSLEKIAVVNVDSKISTGALITSIPLPVGYSPSATAANPATQQVIVISFNSPDVQIIDATQDKLVATRTSPVTQSVLFSGGSCMICGALVDPTVNKLILDTAQGYLLLDLSSGVFSSFLPALTAENFALNPNTGVVISPTYNVSSFSGLQAIFLSNNSVFTYTDFVGIEPDAAAVDFATNIAIIPEEFTNNQHLINMNEMSFASGNFSAPRAVFSTATFSSCDGLWTMVSVESTSHTLFLASEFSDCAGIENLPTVPVSGVPPLPSTFRWGHMPPSPDGFFWDNGRDPHGIAVFTSVLDGKPYGFLVDVSQNWVARIDLTGLAGAPLLSGSATGQVDLTPFVFFLKTQ